MSIGYKSSVLSSEVEAVFHISMSFSPRLKGFVCLFVFAFCGHSVIPADNDEQTVVCGRNNGDRRFGFHMHKETLHFRRKEHI